MEAFNCNKYIRDIRFEEHLEHIPILFIPRIIQQKWMKWFQI